MNISKIHFAYFSPINATRKMIYNVMSSLTHGIPNAQYNLTALKERSRIQFMDPDELLVAAVPTFGGRVPQLSPPLFRNMHGSGTPALVIVTYGGRGYDDTFMDMRQILDEQGFVTVAGAAFVVPHSLAGDIPEGRPNQDDLTLAREFGAKMREKIAAMPEPQPCENLPGNLPMKEPPPPMPFSPITNDRCVLCMQCYRWCPVDAIPWNDPNKTFADRCIMCCGCVVRCPVKAREVCDEAFQKRIAGFRESMVGKSPPSEFFL